MFQAQWDSWLSWRVDKPPTIDVLFTFEKLKVFTNDERFPTSNEKEEKDMKNMNNELLKNYPFTFQFLCRYQPRKVYMESFSNNNQWLVEFNCLHRILNCDSITTVKFNGRIPTPYCFLYKALSESKIKSLRIRIPKHNQPLCKKIKGENEVVPTTTTTTGIYLNCKEMIFDQLSRNKTLKRLVIVNLEKDDYPRLFQSLKSGISMVKTIGLTKPGQLISGKDLEPLLELPNVTTLYCHSHQLDAYLEHIKINGNIKTLKCQYCQSIIQMIYHNKSANWPLMEFLQRNDNNRSNLENLILFGDFETMNVDELPGCDPVSLSVEHFIKTLNNSYFNRHPQLKISFKIDFGFDYC
eukprot:gene479-607_t